MKRTLCLLMSALAGAGLPLAEPIGEDQDAKSRLMWFLGDEEHNKTLIPLIDQLDAESFAERKAATGKLAALPSLPAFVRRLAITDDRPEVRSRLSLLVKFRPVAKETEELNAILKQIADQKVPATLAALSQVVQAEVWDPDAALLGRAARATVGSEDLPLLRDSLANPSAAVRRLAAAAYGGLPAEHSAAPLGKLMDDPDNSVAMVAATGLARLGDRSCLATFARLLDAPDLYTRHRSWSALQGLTGRSFGFDPAATENERKPGSRRWQEWATQPEAAITGKLPESSAITLFNGKDLTGWTISEDGRLGADQSSWAVRDGSLVSLGKGRGDIRTNRAFENYVLTLRYKIKGPAGDSGIGVMLTKENESVGLNNRGDAGNYLEVQILPKRAGDLYLIGSFVAQAKGQKINFSSRRTAEVDDVAGQWHQMKLTVRDGAIEVEINGTVVNQASGGTKGPGKILLRNEGHQIAYKDLLILPIKP